MKIGSILTKLKVKLWVLRAKGLTAVWNDLTEQIWPRELTPTEFLAKQSRAKIPADVLGEMICGLSTPPTFSILIPTDGADSTQVEKTLRSIRTQIFPPIQVILLESNRQPPLALEANSLNIELLILPDAPHDLLKHIRGDYLGIIFPGDVVSDRFLASASLAADQNSQAAILYCDEVVQGARGEMQLLLKPDWSPDFLLSTDYIGRSVIFHLSTLRKRDLIWTEFNRVTLFDLTLRVCEIGGRACHIPEILYTRAALMGAEPDPTDGMARAIRAAVKRRGGAAVTTSVADHPGLFISNWLPEPSAFTSILIASHDRPELLEKCLHSIFSKTASAAFEVILIDHESTLPQTKDIIYTWTQREPERFRCLPYSGLFNFSKLNNFAAAQAKGNLLALLNNDTEVISEDWLGIMAGQAMRKETGAVGAMLLYPDRRVQHAGILMGTDDLAVHAFKNETAGSPGFMGRLCVPNNFLAVTAACLMVRAETYRAAGGLDEAYAVAGGDIDFCVRLVEKGLYNVVLPQVRLFHFESATRGYEDSFEKFTRLQKELDLLRQRWPQYVHQDPYYHPALDRKGKFRLKA